MELGRGAYLCRGKEVLRAPGRSRIPNERLAARAAAKRAREDLSKLTRSWVNHLISTHHKGRNTDLSSADRTVRQLSDAALRLSKIVETYRDDNGVLHSLAQLRVSAATRAWDELNWNTKGEAPFNVEDPVRSFHEPEERPEVCMAE